MSELIRVMARLRNPDGGCPWDLEQDFSTIAPYTIEEAYEVADAIARGDMEALREELGDLLLQPVYHAQMASEKGLFDIHDVIAGVTRKMIHRHPHVFGDTKAATAEDVNVIWDKRKDLENGKKKDASALDGVARALPALLRAEKLLGRAAKAGFKWEKMDDVYAKLDEETAELKAATASGKKSAIAEEIGDMLFVLANIARMNGINPETALRDCNTKFERRFKGMEEDFKKEGQDLSGASLDQMLQMWVRQKRKESSL